MTMKRLFGRFRLSPRLAEQLQEAPTEAFDRARIEAGRELRASLERPSAFVNTFIYSPEQVRAVEMAWLEQHGDVAMGILHREALGIEEGREWQRWEEEAINRLEEVLR